VRLGGEDADRVRVLAYVEDRVGVLRRPGVVLPVDPFDGLTHARVVRTLAEVPGPHLAHSVLYPTLLVQDDLARAATDECACAAARPDEPQEALAHRHVEDHRAGPVGVAELPDPGVVDVRVERLDLGVDPLARLLPGRSGGHVSSSGS
jgi:hypothetical protein